MHCMLRRWRVVDWKWILMAEQDYLKYNYRVLWRTVVCGKAETMWINYVAINYNIRLIWNGMLPNVVLTLSIHTSGKIWVYRTKVIKALCKLVHPRTAATSSAYLYYAGCASALGTGTLFFLIFPLFYSPILLFCPIIPSHYSYFYPIILFLYNEPYVADWI